LDHRLVTAAAVCLFVHIPGNDRLGTKDNVFLEMLTDLPCGQKAI
jgi:hypothetical protein